MKRRTYNAMNSFIWTDRQIKLVRTCLNPCNWQDIYLHPYRKASSRGAYGHNFFKVFWRASTWFHNNRYYNGTIYIIDNDIILSDLVESSRYSSKTLQKGSCPICASGRGFTVDDSAYAWADPGFSLGGGVQKGNSMISYVTFLWYLLQYTWLPFQNAWIFNFILEVSVLLD